MKNVSVILIVLFVVVAASWGVWAGHLHSSKGVSAQASASPTKSFVAKPPTPIPPQPFLKPTEWQEFNNDRQNTLQKNTALASEYNGLLSEMEQQQKDLEAAMIKADPAAATAIAKLDSMHKYGPAPAGTPSTANNATLSPDEWQQIRDARQAALKANPDFNIKAKELADKLRDFQQKLTAAMVASDPNVAPILAKFSGSHPVPKPSPLPAKTE